MLAFYPGFDIDVDYAAMTFTYGAGVFGPAPERRHLDDIRRSLRNPACDGPEVPYVVSMDAGKQADQSDLRARNLLYGAMIYAAGRLGEEPVRSQGHIHAVSASCGCSTPEVYEIWDGEAIVYMQQTADDNPGRCLAVRAAAGQVVVVPPGWAHCTVNADPTRHMAFGAWCVRDYGFDYRGVRAHGGLAYFPVLSETGRLSWEANSAYDAPALEVRDARNYDELGLEAGVPIYEQYERDRSRFSFVTTPDVARDVWERFEP